MKKGGMLCVLLAALLVFLCAFPVSAGNSTANTYTVSVNWEWIKTQDAYLPGQVYFKDEGLNRPSDIVVMNMKMYVADSDNGRILIKDLNDREKPTEILGEGTLNRPTGIYVTTDGTIYVADAGSKTVVVMGPDGGVRLTIGEPDSPMFGADAMWEPSKVAVDGRGNIYVMSEGGFNGLVQFSKTGEFLGYFGSNQTSKSLVETIQDIFFTAEQIAQLFNRKPAAFTNVAIDQDGLVYTITANGEGNVVKKHNVAGSNILPASKNRNMFDDTNFADITVGKWGQIYVVSNTGVINEYDYNGNIHFSFGGLSIATDLNGLFTVPSGIAVDDNDCVYVLDYEKGIVQSFYPTAFANMTHQALSLYDRGQYEDSMVYWKQVLQLSGSSQVAHYGMGKCYMNLGDYENAAYHFKIASDKASYSDAYWELRDQWMTEHTVFVVLGIVMVVVLLFVLVHKRKHKEGKYVYSPYVCPPGKGFWADMKFMAFSCRHPIDAALYIKSGQKVSTFSAVVVGILGVLVYLFDYVYRGFIFNHNSLRYTQYTVVLATVVIPVVLWAICNYMIATIHAGDGTFKKVFRSTIYAFSPYILITPFTTILSMFLTNDEGFILTIISNVVVVWVVITLFLFIKKVQDFTFWETVKNILITIFLIIVILIAAALIYSLWNSISEFLVSVYREVFYRGLNK